MFLSYLYLAFKVWMLVDAAQRRAEVYWYFVIFFVPFGDVAYFFVVKRQDFGNVTRSLQKRLDVHTGASLKSLRYQAEQNPSVANRLSLATALYDRKAYDEAHTLYETVLDAHPHEIAALYGSGLALMAMGRFGEAANHFRQVIESEPTYQGYGAWRDLTQALWQDGQKEAALQQMEAWFKKDSRCSAAAEYAAYLVELGRSAEAKSLLERAVQDYRHSPAYVQRAERAGYRKAQAILRKI